jgi:hypothetical protein
VARVQMLAVLYVLDQLQNGATPVEIPIRN